MGKAKAAPAASTDGTAKLAGTAYHAASRSVAAREQALQAAGRLCDNGEKWAKRIGARQSPYEFIELWWSLPAATRACPPPQSNGEKCRRCKKVVRLARRQFIKRDEGSRLGREATKIANMNASMLVRLLFAALCAAPARAICREPHPLLPTYWSADEPKLAVVGIYFKDLPASHVPTPAEFAAMVHGPAVVAALDRMSDGCLNATTFAPDFYVVKNEGATHPLEEGGRVSCGQADDFFETSSVRNLGFDFDDYDGSFCVGGAPLLDAPSACDDPLPPPCLDQTRCFPDETIWNKLVHQGTNGKGKDGNCGGMRNLCPQPGAWASRDSISLSGEPFCETDHLMACSENGSHYSQGIINARHECWQNGGDAADMACVRALCEATPECGGYTITTHDYEESRRLEGGYPEGHLNKALWFKTASIAEPDGANWRYECWRKPKLEAPCYCNAPGEQTQPAGACASPGADTTTTTTTAALSAAPTPAPSEAPTPAPSSAPTGDTTTTTTTTAAPSPAPTPAPTGDAAAATCEDDADWLAKSDKKKQKSCKKQKNQNKCKKKKKKGCAWVEGACVEKLQTCDDLFNKEGAKLAKACKKQGTIGGATEKVKASAACQKACGTCDAVGAVVGATTTTADFSSIEDGGGAAEDYAHCWERGYCVEADGSYYGDRNSAYGPADPDSGVVQLASGAAWHDESHEKALECMSLCNANPDFKGCEIVFGKHNRGCYGHTRAVARGHVTCDRPPCGAASGWQAKCWVKDWGCAAEAPTKPPSGPSAAPHAAPDAVLELQGP
ncbi:hypothetical protein AURANDRAFT_68837, partial [Aureococcus anophagefferens]